VKQQALSLKQPWATLLAHGHKTIEVRKWATKVRGRVFIHAARIPDERTEAWALLDHYPDLLEEAQQLGGILGVGQLWNCLAYRTLAGFANDSVHHLNDPSWFQPPVLYGFVFRGLRPLPFRPYPGWMRFFDVTLEE
jgi:hypothetical protein